MKLPRSYRKLAKIFHNATGTNASDFKGEYLVDILFLPGYRAVSHHKVFYSEDDKVLGFNVIFTKKWGYFFLEESSDKNYSSQNVVINYDRPENSFLIRRIRDHIRCIEKEKLYIGRFHYVIMGNSRFIGYFSMKKVM